MKALWTALALIALAVTPLRAEPPGVVVNGRTDSNLMQTLQTYDNVVIRYGAGGYVDGMLQTMAYLRDHPEKHITIDGECVSACTLLLAQSVSRTNVCYTANARFSFHSAYYEEAAAGAQGTSKVRDPKYNSAMLVKFNPSMRQWIIRTRAYSQIDTYQTMSYAEATKFRDMRCDRGI